MLKLDKILVPTDFSEFADKAMQYACALASRFDAELHLLHVVHDNVWVASEAGTMGPPVIEQFVADARAAAERSLADLPGSDWDDGRQVVRDIRTGNPFVEIIGYARQLDVDLIVIGTHGRSGLQHVLLGSVAERVVRKSPCPVLSVRAEGHQFVMP